MLTGEFESKHKVMDDVYYAVRLHDYPELLDDCCELINMEWQRSHAARLRSISGSSNNFPTSIILLKQLPKPAIIGHCKLNKISQSSPVVFVDTVVIHPHYRKRGLGKLLMEKAEQYLKSKDIEWIYLTTMGQELFYEKLGYSVCEPINIYGGQFNHIFKNEAKPMLHQTEQSNISLHGMKCLPKTSENSVETSQISHLQSLSIQPKVKSASIPPPPPMPCLKNNITYITSKKVFMRKKIC